MPSRFILPSLRRLSDEPSAAGDRVGGRRYAGAMMTSGSFAGELLQTTALAHEQEWRTRQAAAFGAGRRPHCSCRPHDDRGPWTAFTRFDGNLSGVDGLPDYAAGVRLISPTALESYADCPHASSSAGCCGSSPSSSPRT